MRWRAEARPPPVQVVNIARGRQARPAARTTPSHGTDPWACRSSMVHRTSTPAMMLAARRGWRRARGTAPCERGVRSGAREPPRAGRLPGGALALDQVVRALGRVAHRLARCGGAYRGLGGGRGEKGGVPASFFLFLSRPGSAPAPVAPAPGRGLPPLRPGARGPALPLPGPPPAVTAAGAQGHRRGRRRAAEAGPRAQDPRPRPLPRGGLWCPAVGAPGARKGGR